MTRLDDSFAAIRQLGATYAGTMTLVRWAESERGRTATFRLDDGPDADAVHPFKGLPAHPKDGQRFRALLIMVGDVADEPEVPSDAPSEAVGKAVPANESAGAAVPKERRTLAEMSFAARAGMLIGEKTFWQWLRETAAGFGPDSLVGNAKEADAEMKRRIGGIISKRDLDRWPEAAERFVTIIETPYRDYVRNGEFARAAQ